MNSNQTTTVNVERAKNVVAVALVMSYQIINEDMLVLVQQPIKGEIPEATVKAVGKSNVLEALINNGLNDDLHLLEQVSSKTFVKLPIECLA